MRTRQFIIDGKPILGILLAGRSNHFKIYHDEHCDYILDIKGMLHRFNESDPNFKLISAYVNQKYMPDKAKTIALFDDLIDRLSKTHST